MRVVSVVDVMAEAMDGLETAAGKPNSMASDPCSINPYRSAIASTNARRYLIFNISQLSTGNGLERNPLNTMAKNPLVFYYRYGYYAFQFPFNIYAFSRFYYP